MSEDGQAFGEVRYVSPSA